MYNSNNNDDSNDNSNNNNDNTNDNDNDNDNDNNNNNDNTSNFKDLFKHHEYSTSEAKMSMRKAIRKNHRTTSTTALSHRNGEFIRRIIPEFFWPNMFLG